MSSLALETSKCFQALSSLVRWLTASRHPLLWISDVEDQIGRLRIWSSNVGASASGPASLDHRLHGAPTMAQNVLKLLLDLSSQVREMLSVLRALGPFSRSKTLW